jgi:DNA-binding CsgD family transcriptional regulator
VDDELEFGGELKHYGIKRRSGRYPWGSGNDPYQNSTEFRDFYKQLKAKGLTEGDIAKEVEVFGQKSDPRFKFKSTDLRDTIAISTEYIRAENIARAQSLAAKQMSNTAIAKEMGTNESTVRGWLKSYNDRKESVLVSTAKNIQEQVDRAGFLDVGKGSHLHMNISSTKFNTAVAYLKDMGYVTHSVNIPQLSMKGQFTKNKVLTPEGVTWAEARQALLDGRVPTVNSKTEDGGLTWTQNNKPEAVSVNSKRLQVKWKEDGGAEMDGVIELRRGVEDLSLGKSRYAQVRVAVDGTHYLKGMAMYADDLPKGIDIRFNTNKSKADTGGDKLKAMKELKADPMDKSKVDPTRPFGASTYNTRYIDKNGKERVSPLNIVNEEGAWDKWSKNLSSQMLSKQSVPFAAEQLGKARAKREKELAEIMALTNPVVKVKLLDKFAESADSAAVHLKAAKIERQATSVILPFNSIRPTEVYAPNFKHGEKVVLVRHPHGGPFEIPSLTVNNNNAAAKRAIGGAKDAIGIHHKVAEQLSGADFDGDTVLVIPNASGKVKTKGALPGLEGFDAKAQYKIPDDDKVTKRMSKQETQTQMGKISNLITDMSLQNASDTELAAAVRHSMVVIDAEKHGLNYKKSEVDNRIKELKAKYQPKVNGAGGGASTLISRASSDASVPHRRAARVNEQPGGPVNPKTGELQWTYTGKSYVDKNGKVVMNITKGTKMGFAKDARELLSGGLGPGNYARRGTPMEKVYADHANAMKALANKARKESYALNAKLPEKSKTAEAVYAAEVASLNNKLKVALSNKPLERRAQSIGAAIAKMRIDANPELDKDERKRIESQSLQEARDRVGANKKRIGTETNPLTDREWDAIQAGAISKTKLREILDNSDMNRIKTLATPRPRTAMTPGQLARAKTMEASGKSPTEIAAALGLPRSTVVDNLKNA